MEKVGARRVGLPGAAVILATTLTVAAIYLKHVGPGGLVTRPSVAAHGTVARQSAAFRLIARGKTLLTRFVPAAYPRPGPGAP
jgi:hypothetical protein